MAMTCSGCSSAVEKVLGKLKGRICRKYNIRLIPVVCLSPESRLTGVACVPVLYYVEGHFIVFD